MEPSPQDRSARQVPGGLVALAILNFCFGGIVLVVLALQVLHAHPEALGQVLIQRVLILKGVVGALLIVSGVGFLEQSWLWGRVLGNAAAIGAIADPVVQGILEPGLHLDLTGLAYGVVLLSLINSVYRDALSSEERGGCGDER